MNCEVHGWREVTPCPSCFPEPTRGWSNRYRNPYGPQTMGTEREEKTHLPPKPKFEVILINPKDYGQMDTTTGLSRDAFDNWYANIFENAKVVYQTEGNNYWYPIMDSTDTHKALVIGIKPIEKKLTADELLKEIVNVGRIEQGASVCISKNGSFYMNAVKYLTKKGLLK